MFARILPYLLHRPGIVVSVVCAAVAAAGWRLARLPVDVWPDLSPVQVQVLTPAPDQGAEEVEAAITRPLERECAGTPGLTALRSVSTFGLSQLVLVFQDGTDLARARQWTQERIANALVRLPAGRQPKLGPPSDGLGEIYTYALRYRGGFGSGEREARLARLKTLQDFLVRPRLLAVPGVVEVNATGGFDPELVVEPDPKKLFQAGLDVADLASALEANVAIGGGALLPGGSEQTVVRSSARAQTAEEIAGSSVKLSWGSTAVNVRDLAEVRLGTKIRFGAASLNGEEAVLGTVLTVAGGDAARTAPAVRSALQAVRHALPPDVELLTVYNRATLTAGALRTVGRNLLTAALLVTAVLWGFFRCWRAAAIVAAVIPLAFTLGLGASSLLGVSGNLMSLGALDFGLVVDAAVVFVDEYLRRLRSAQEGRGPLRLSDRLRVAGRGTLGMAPPLVAGWAVILLGYAPALFLEGTDARIFQPMSVTAALTLLAAFPLSLCAVPVAAAWLVREAPGRAPWPERASAAYLGSLEAALRHRGTVVAAATALCLGGSLLAARLGFDLLPPLDEGSTVLEIEKPVTTNLQASVEEEKATERLVLARFPEVHHLYSRLGFSDVASDPQAPSQNDLYIFYRPRRTWPLRDGQRPTKTALERRIAETVREAFPRTEFALNQPIRLRLDEMLEGTHADLAVELYGPDLAALDQGADAVAGALSGIAGTGEVLTDPVGEIRRLTFQPDRSTLARYLVKAGEIDRALAAGLMGREVGRVDLPDRFYPIAVRLAEPERNDAARLLALPVRSAEGTLMLTLGQLGRFEPGEGVNRILHANQERRRTVMVNVRDRDLGGYVAAVEGKFKEELRLPPGLRLEMGGHFRRLRAALDRLAWAIPGLLLVAFAVVWSTVRSLRLAAALFSAVPLALIGGIAALALRGMSLSVSALLGLTAVGGIALLNKLVFVHTYGRRRRGGAGAWPAVLAATRARIRPVLSTAILAGMGFLPMALSGDLGSEVQRPIATVMIGGLFTSTAVTLFLLPVLLFLVDGDRSVRRVRREVGEEVGVRS